MKNRFNCLSAFAIILLCTINSFDQDTLKRLPALKPANTNAGTTSSVRVQQTPAKISVWAQLQKSADSLKVQKRRTIEAQLKIDIQNKTIAGLKDSIQLKNENLAQSEETNNVSFLGYILPFATYNTILLGAILFFAAAFSIVLLRSGRYRSEAKYRINLYQELSDEFQAHKMKANEKEKKLARELQDERNKIEEMKGR